MNAAACPPGLSPEQIDSFRSEIWGFFRAHGRSFPWREGADPYRIMVSEFMLQQTQTARVVEKYGAWLERFPTVRSLADAGLGEVLALWNGLGYNRRAKYLHEACREICASYGGCVPCDAKALDALPGIGVYTARAIMAFAFGRPEVFIETNIRSVFIHFFFAEGGLPSVSAACGTDAVPPAPRGESPAAVSDRDILPLVEQTLDRSRPRLWYYALMDYGAQLKRRGQNPSRRSRGYTRQGRFEGSPRQARGAILRQLSQLEASCAPEGSGSRGLSLEAVAGRERIDVERLRSAAAALVAEGLVREQDGLYCLG